tara:strand:+ start:24138 stop:24956 length:819 start_codon:yes stop_codon:yes gene_type:complete
MDRENLIKQIKLKRSFLCIGLDTDINKIPSHLLEFEDPIFEFNKRIIDETKDLCVAYKPNIAFYESLGVNGWKSLNKTLNYIPKEIFTIADAKRGDIGNTSKMYAKTFLENMDFDSLTVNPFMGADSVKPFLSIKDKWAIILALTSNEGSSDFQRIKSDRDKFIFEHILEITKNWGTDNNIMYVVGATRSDFFIKIRRIIPSHFLLVPGIGHQGGELEDFAKYGMNDECGLLVNSSRGIIYAGEGKDFHKKSRESALQIQRKMDVLLSKRGI